MASKSTYRATALLLPLAAVLLAFQSCAPQGDKDAAGATGSAITIAHAYGETVIPAKPARVATIGWGNHDLPLSLGVVPVGVSKANYGVIDGSGILPWTKEGFARLGVDSPTLFDDIAGLDYEAIAAVSPDVILAAYSGITKEEYDLLSEIAPVVAFPRAPWQTYWREQITINATGMGLKDEGEAKVKELEAFIADKVAAHPVLAGKKAAFFYFNPADLGSFYVYLPTDPRAAFLQDLGLAVPPSVAELATKETSFAISLSAEKIDLLKDVEVIIAYGNDELVNILQKDPLVGTMPAVRNGAIAAIEDNTPLAASGTPSALSIPATLETYLDLVAAAAAKVQ